MSEPPLTMADFDLSPHTAAEELKYNLAKRREGRPSYVWDEDIANYFLELVSHGMSFKSVCAIPGMPCWQTVSKRIENDPEFANLVQRAQRAGVEYKLSEVFEIADNTDNDTVTITYGRGDNAIEKEVANTEWINRTKLRVETRFKAAQFHNPNKYNVAAARVEHEHDHRHSGKIEHVSVIEVQVVEPDPTLAITSVEDIEADETEG